MISTDTQPRCYFMSLTWSDSPVSTHTRALASELVRRGHKVVLLVDQQNREVEDHEANPAVYSWPSRRPTKLKDVLFLRRLIKKYRPDCLVAAFGATNVMLCVGRWMGVPNRVAWYLSITEGITIDGPLGKWKLKVLRFRKRMVYRFLTHLLPNSEAGSQEAQRRSGIPPHKCTVLYLSLPDPKLELNGSECRRDENRVVCVGRLHPFKGQDVLLKSIAKIKDRCPHATFEFVGDGPFRAECEQLAAKLGIADRCDFLGRVPHDQVLLRMGSASVAVVPSRFECFGLVNIESLAMGTPVVASDVGGIGEIFKDGEEGFLVPADDPDALAERLAKLLNDAELRKRMSEKAIERFQKFEQSNVIGDQVDWFESITT